MKGTIVFRLVAITLLTISTHLVSASVEDEYWTEFDADGSGTVSEAELKAGFQKHRITLKEEQAKEIMNVADLNNDGTINKPEFILHVMPFFRFSAFDSDKSGDIKKDEIKIGFTGFGITVKPERVDEIAKVADENHDGKITYREFVSNIQPYYKFVKFDTDDSGSITKDELKQGFATLSVTITEKTLEHVFQVGDRNNDDHISYTEFVHRVYQFFMFDEIDKDDNGSINEAELKETLGNYGITLTDDKAKALILIADLNDDGTVVYREYLHEIDPYFRFVKLDKNHNGELSKQELGEGLKLYGIVLDETRLSALLKVGDTNGDNQINYAEYVRKIDAKFVFRRFDKNRNGLLDKNELKDGFEFHGLTLDQAQLDALFTISDSIKKDGSINYEEFVRKTFPYFVFRKFDHDKTGCISKDELKKGMQYHGIELDDTQLTELYTTANTKTTDNITYDEFIAVIEPYFRFRRLDKNKSGEIDSAELAERAEPLYGKKLTETEATALINEADGGAKNGKLDFKEYLKIDNKIV